MQTDASVAPSACRSDSQWARRAVTLDGGSPLRLGGATMMPGLPINFGWVSKVRSMISASLSGCQWLTRIIGGTKTVCAPAIRLATWHRSVNP